jgi:hypothetical protein
VASFISDGADLSAGPLEVQRSLDNGRALQDLLHQAAPRYIKALKRARQAKKSDEG